MNAQDAQRLVTPHMERFLDDGRKSGSMIFGLNWGSRVPCPGAVMFGMASGVSSMVMSQAICSTIGWLTGGVSGKNRLLEHMLPYQILYQGWRFGDFMRFFATDWGRKLSDLLGQPLLTKSGSSRWL